MLFAESETVELKSVYVEDIKKEIQFIMATLGYKMDDAKQGGNRSDILHTTRNGITAFGVYDGEKFEVLEGSEIDMSRKCHSDIMERQRQVALANGNIVLANGKYKLNLSASFSSPSSAGMFVLGGSINGWIEWKNKDDKTLDEIFRK